MDREWRTFWRVCYSTKFQHTVDCAAAMLLPFMRRELGPVLSIWSVSVVNFCPWCLPNDPPMDTKLILNLSQWRPWTVALLLTILFMVFAGVELGLVYAIRPPYQRGIDWPVLLIGIISFILLIGAYFGVPIELLKRRGRVIGIDFVFLTVDWCGAFFSLMSLIAQSEFDVLFGTMYALCCAIEMSMVVSHLIWRVRTRDIRKMAGASGKTFDESEEGQEWQAKGIDIEKKFWRLVGREDKAGGSEELEEGNKNTVPFSSA